MLALVYFVINKNMQLLRLENTIVTIEFDHFEFGIFPPFFVTGFPLSSLKVQEYIHYYSFHV